MTAENIKEQFKAELKALLAKYNADIEAEDHFSGYAECGEDIRISVTIPTIWGEDGEIERRGDCIDLGNYFDKNSK